MDNKITKIEKLVKFEKQMLNSLTQEVLSLANRTLSLVRVIERLDRDSENNWMDSVEDLEPVSAHGVHSAMKASVEIKLAELQNHKSKLEKKLDQARERLGNQKVRTKVLEELLQDRTRAYLATLEEEELRELLDIANRRFTESES